MGSSQKRGYIYHDERPGMENMYHSAPGLRGHVSRHRPHGEYRPAPREREREAALPWGAMLLVVAVLGLLWVAFLHVPQLQGRGGDVPPKGTPPSSRLHGPVP